MAIYHIDMVILDIDMGDEANDMGDDRINTVISHIDMGYLVTLLSTTLLPGRGDDERAHDSAQGCTRGRGSHSSTFGVNLRTLRGVLVWVLVTETAQVELRSGRV